MGKTLAIREAFGSALLDLGRTNDKVVVLDCDLSHPCRTYLFGQKYPERFFNMGVAEQNMVSVAAGMATTGLIPFASTFGFLFTTRALDQVRSSIAYPNLNVKLAAAYCGVSNPSDGATHHSVFDIAVMRALPNMTVVVVSDAIRTKQAVQAAAEHEGPVYIRLARARSEVLDGCARDFKLGKAMKLKECGQDVGIVVTGLLVPKALTAAKLLAAEGINATVIEVHTIKPIDEEAIRQLAETTGALVTGEEHSIIGGLGSAVAETLTAGPLVPIERVGIKDTFAESGDYEGLLAKLGLTAQHVAGAARRVLSRKDGGGRLSDATRPGTVAG